MRQQQKFEKKTEVLNASEFLRKKVLKEHRKKRGESTNRNKSLTR